jgi:hypothetical protein
MAARARASDPASLSMWLLAVTQVSGTTPSRSVQVTRPTAPTIVSPRKITVKGAPTSRPFGQTLDCDLPRQTHWHLSGWMGQCRCSGDEGRADNSCSGRAT